MDGALILDLVASAGDELCGRKRLQKALFLLKSAGVPVDAQFELHHYGPYSRDVAQACDELVTLELLKETQSSESIGAEYSYRVSPTGSVMLV